MKGMIYDFVKSNNSKQKVFVTYDLDNIENIHKAEFVYEVGIKDKLSDIGIKGIIFKYVREDVIIDRSWNSESISKLCLPHQQLIAKFVPCFKHLRVAGYLNHLGKLDEVIDVVEFTHSFISKVNRNTRKDFFPSSNYPIKHTEINDKYNSLKYLADDLPTPLHQLVFIPLLEDSKIDLTQFIKYLADNIALLSDRTLGSYFRKLVCLFDFLKFK